MSDKAEMIGQLNGKWAMMFKALLALSLALLPFFLALQIWYVTNIYALKMDLAVLNSQVGTLHQRSLEN